METENAIFQDLESFRNEEFLNGNWKMLDFCLGKF